MSVKERLIRYCSIDTQSDPASGTHPSAEKEFDLAHLLLKELKELGIQDAELDEHCYLYGHLEANTDQSCSTVGFIAHMDTAPDYSGTGVKPQIIENFDGNDITLKDGTITSMKDFPQMKKLKGKTLMVTDGTTLLGGDDKAGITSIMEALVYLKAHPEIKHGRISIAFTPDEEIGEGPLFFDLTKFGADFAYTMDGDAVNVMSDETFNASAAVVSFTGFSIHPGEAKNRMVNAAALACMYQSLLPQAMTPEHTEGKEGFLHLTGIKGNTDHAELSYIIRDHDAALLEKKKELLKKTAEYINAWQGADVAKVEISDTYRNMKEVLKKHPEVSQIAWDAMKAIGLSPENVPVRGGTDGAELSYRGLPCPNLGCGGGNFHGRYEYCCLEELEQSVQLIVKISELTLERGGK